MSVFTQELKARALSENFFNEVKYNEKKVHSVTSLDLKSHPRDWNGQNLRSIKHESCFGPCPVTKISSPVPKAVWQEALSLNWNFFKKNSLFLPLSVTYPLSGLPPPSLVLSSFLFPSFFFHLLILPPLLYASALSSSASSIGPFVLSCQGLVPSG